MPNRLFVSRYLQDYRLFLCSPSVCGHVLLLSLIVPLVNSGLALARPYLIIDKRFAAVRDTFRICYLSAKVVLYFNIPKKNIKKLQNILISVIFTKSVLFFSSLSRSAPT